MNRIRFNPRRRAGYSLIELLMSISILVVVMNMSTELFRTVLRTGQDNQSLASETSRVDMAIAQLRRDVWGSGHITVADPHAVTVQLAGSDAVHWAITPDSVQRTAPDGTVTQWPGIGSAWAFSTDPGALTVTDAKTPDAPPYRLVSEVVISRRAQ
jgi:prepilin-type N-terminal cleavage/methylation domain-containing protein